MPPVVTRLSGGSTLELRARGNGLYPETDSGRRSTAELRYLRRERLGLQASGTRRPVGFSPSPISAVTPRVASVSHGAPTPRKPPRSESLEDRAWRPGCERTQQGPQKALPRTRGRHTQPGRAKRQRGDMRFERVAARAAYYYTPRPETGGSYAHPSASISSISVLPPARGHDQGVGSALRSPAAGASSAGAPPPRSSSQARGLSLFSLTAARGPGSPRACRGPSADPGHGPGSRSGRKPRPARERHQIPGHHRSGRWPHPLRRRCPH